MKRNKEISQYLTAQAEKIELAAWELIDRFDHGETISSESVEDIKRRAALVMSNAQSKAEAKQLDKILGGALFNLKSIV